jgi:hypothetical protein
MYLFTKVYLGHRHLQELAGLHLGGKQGDTTKVRMLPLSLTQLRAKRGWKEPAVRSEDGPV